MNTNIFALHDGGKELHLQTFLAMALECYFCWPCTDSNWHEVACKDEVDPVCKKTTTPDDTVIRTCFPKVPQWGLGCHEEGGGSVCFCDTDYCNGAGALQGIALLTCVAVLTAKIVS